MDTFHFVKCISTDFIRPGTLRSADTRWVDARTLNMHLYMHLICANFSEGGSSHRKNVATPYPFLPTPIKKYHERIEHNLPPQGKSETVLMLYTISYLYVVTLIW